LLESILYRRNMVLAARDHPRSACARTFLGAAHRPLAVVRSVIETSLLLCHHKSCGKENKVSNTIACNMFILKGIQQNFISAKPKQPPRITAKIFCFLKRTNLHIG